MPVINAELEQELLTKVREYLQGHPFISNKTFLTEILEPAIHMTSSMAFSNHVIKQIGLVHEGSVMGSRYVMPGQATPIPVVRVSRVVKEKKILPRDPEEMFRKNPSLPAQTFSTERERIIARCASLDVDFGVVARVK
jgi:hypothetical protein